MKWNPNTYEYCVDCPHYHPVGTYIYELERDPKERKCNHLRICHRIYKIFVVADQMKLKGI